MACSVVSGANRTQQPNLLNALTLVVLDSRLQDLPQLVLDLESNSSQLNLEILLLNAQQNGLEQISARLAEISCVPGFHISSLHIVSHGAPGCLYLGSTKLSTTTLDHYQAELNAWKKATQGTDILLYGCQVARGATGRFFLQQLQQLTGANIAAASKPIGRVRNSTNWLLDAEFGLVQSQVLFSQKLQVAYTGNFAPVVDFSINTTQVIEDEGTPFQFNFALSEPPPGGGTVVRLEGSIPQAINQWNLFELRTQGLAGLPVDVSPALDFSAFEITIISQTASISLPIFNDSQPDSPQTITWTVSAVSGGTVNPNANSATVTIFDDASQVPPPDPDDPNDPTNPTSPTNPRNIPGTAAVADVLELELSQTFQVSVLDNSNSSGPAQELIAIAGGQEFTILGTFGDTLRVPDSFAGESLAVDFEFDPGRYQFALRSPNGGGLTFLDITSITPNGFSLSGSGYEIIAQALAPGQPTANILRNVTIGDESALGVPLFGDLAASQIVINATLHREADLENEIGFYLVDATSGGVIDPVTGQVVGNSSFTSGSDHLRAALDFTLFTKSAPEDDSIVEFSEAISFTNLGADIRPMLVPYLIVDGDMSDAMEDVSQVYSTFQSANSDNSQHMIQLSNSAWGLEDLAGGGDNDFDDLIIDINSVSRVA